MYKLNRNPSQIIRVSDGMIISEGNNGDWQLYQEWLAEGNTSQAADALSIVIKSDPKGFYEKAIGAHGSEYPLTLVYKSLIRRSLDQTADTSSLATALLIYNSALNNNDWSQEYAKPAYQEAYSILKAFLTTEQIMIIDAENTEFNLT